MSMYLIRRQVTSNVLLLINSLIIMMILKPDREVWAKLQLQAVEGTSLPPLTEGESLQLQEVELHQGKTSAPDYLTESELIGLMEKNGIGTDASIAVHINNICERNYVSIQAGRKVVPTELGITLVRGYQLIDPELCRAQVQPVFIHMIIQPKELFLTFYLCLRRL